MAIVREHSGNITAEPLATGGSLFTIALPVSQPSQVVFDANSSGPETVQAPVSPLEGRAVLVVDDEDGIRDLIDDGLSARGMIVHTVASAEAALENARKYAYDVVLCDLNLGGPRGTLSGQDLRRELLGVARARTGHQPLFVFMTGDLLDESVLEGLEDKHGRMIQKPFRVSDLAALLLAELETVVSKQSASSRTN
jgi:CheY-like chemotaxis protein